MDEDSMVARIFGPEAWRPLARALEAYSQGDLSATLTVLADEGEPDPLPIAVFFRADDQLREVDREAIRLTRGRVLDVGAGVGAITLALQKRGIETTAVEVIPEAVELMKKRGVKHPRAGRIQDLPAQPVYGTVLLLMNGVALAGTLSRLPWFLEVLSGFLRPGGQILLDSTDLFPERSLPFDPNLEMSHQEATPGSILDPEGAKLLAAESPEGREEYPGELQYQLEFRGEKGAPFPQLFVDPRTLQRAAAMAGLVSSVVWVGGSGDYLARLTRRNAPGAGVRDAVRSFEPHP